MNLETIQTELIQLHADRPGIDIIRPILQPQDDPNADYIAATNYYSWYATIGCYFKPRRIAEIGVRFGYSLYAMATATGHDPGTMRLFGYDLETYEGTERSTRIAQAMMRGAGFIHTNIYKMDTFLVNDLGTDIDLFHVDGDHDYRHVAHDTELAIAALRPGGVLLLDDCEFNPDTGRAARDVLNRHGIEFCLLPTFRGHILAVKP